MYASDMDGSIWVWVTSVYRNPVNKNGWMTLERSYMCVPYYHVQWCCVASYAMFPNLPRVCRGAQCRHHRWFFAHTEPEHSFCLGITYQSSALHAYHTQLYLPAFIPLKEIKVALYSCLLPFSRCVNFFMFKVSYYWNLNYQWKTSTGFELARTASRIALTFIPLVWIKYIKVRKVVNSGLIRGVPTTEEDKARYLKGLRRGRVALKTLLSIPIVLVCATIIASLERTPLTGRCVSFLTDTNHGRHVAYCL